VERCTTPAALQAHLAPARRAGRTLGLVPTMGALHDGHLSLVRAARADCDVVVASVFVNPLQFAPGEDFAAYPRDLEGDLAQLRATGADAVFAPDTAAFTPPDLATTVRVRGLTERLEGAHRRGHLDGVTTVVTKLLHAAWPDRAYFGEKDYQQLVVIRRLVADLDVPVTVVGCPTVREADGLAMSSRNAYLSAAERTQGLALPRALFAVRAAWGGDADYARALLRRRLGDAPGVRLDYAEVCDPETLEPLEGMVQGPARALVAAHVGPARLIDNIRLDPPAAG
jgi:pantoate--beta-alanine ligase